MLTHLPNMATFLIWQVADAEGAAAARRIAAAEAAAALRVGAAEARHLTRALLLSV